MYELHKLQGNLYEIPKNTTVLDLFLEQAKKSAEKTAVLFGDSRITYGKLNKKSDALAKQIRNARLHRSSYVPVILDNCMEFPIVYIALMKAGLPFVPMDPGWPQERIEKLLESIDTQCIITKEEYYTDRRCIYVHQESLDLSDDSNGQDGQTSPKPADPMYAFFTSGSTGLPKCAINIHIGIVNRLLYMNRRFHITETDVVLQNSRQIFDSSIWQIFLPLINGASLVIPQLHEHFDVDNILDTISDFKITMTDFVPSIFDILVNRVVGDDTRMDKLQSLRQLLIGGEEMNPQTVYLFKAFFPHVGITNTYGPTEASIGTVFYEVDNKRYNPIPIGRAIDNVKAIVLDEEMRRVDINEIGELYIGGVCLGGGYLNDAEKTEKAFIKNPFPELDCDRLYKTGDLVYHTADGNLYFMGRKDFQVKINGVRIELQEIENSIAGIEGVIKVRVAINGGDDNKELIAFVEMEKDKNQEFVQKRIKEIVPKSMIPNKILFVDKMPLNQNGKVDRKKLMDFIRNASTEDLLTIHKEEMDEEVKLISAVFSKILGIENVPEQKSFFELGGSSLSVLKVVNELQNQNGIKIELRDIIQHPTVTELSRLIKNKSGQMDERKKRSQLIKQFENDLKLDNNIAINVGGIREEEEGTVKNILLTGATGFIGIHILYELLQSTTAHIYCLTSQTREGDLVKRLNEIYSSYNLGTIDPDRVDVIYGMIQHEKFLLETHLYNRLVQEVDTVINCASIVNIVLGYEQLRETNVYSMQHLLRFATTSYNKHFIHISSLTAFGTSFDQIVDCGVINPLALPPIGYEQTKWMQERFLEIAKNRGVKCTVMRLGEVFASKASGIANEKSCLTKLLDACFAENAIPESNGSINLFAVDEIASFVRQIIMDQSLQNKTYNLPAKKDVTWKRITDSFDLVDCKFKKVKFDQFYELLKADGNEFEIFLNPDMSNDTWFGELFTEIENKISYENDTICPDSDVTDRMLVQFISSIRNKRNGI